jgi:cytochrome oxidase Cu insertion factor (SCO1/SenC/PrrC family)
LFLNGTFVNEEYSLVYFEFFECKNTTENEICKPKSLIDKTLQGSFYQFAYTDISIDPSDYINPNKEYLASSYGILTNLAYKDIHHYFKQIKITTDKGWLLSDISEDNYFQFDYTKEMFDLRI